MDTPSKSDRSASARSSRAAKRLAAPALVTTSQRVAKPARPWQEAAENRTLEPTLDLPELLPTIHEESMPIQTLREDPSMYTSSNGSTSVFGMIKLTKGSSSQQTPFKTMAQTQRGRLSASSLNGYSTILPSMSHCLLLATRSRQVFAMNLQLSFTNES